MSIKTTIDITRQDAIERIKQIIDLIKEHDYLSIYDIANEHEENLEEFVDNFEIPNNIQYIVKWTNEMLENYLDRPFFRRNIFENYFIVNDD